MLMPIKFPTGIGLNTLLNNYVIIYDLHICIYICIYIKEYLMSFPILEVYVCKHHKNQSN